MFYSFLRICTGNIQRKGYQKPFTDIQIIFLYSNRLYTFNTCHKSYKDRGNPEDMDENIIWRSKCNNVTGTGFRYFYTFQAIKSQNLEDAATATIIITVDDGNGSVGFNAATLDTPDTDNSYIAVIVKRADLHLKRTVQIDIRGEDF